MCITRVNTCGAEVARARAVRFGFAGLVGLVFGGPLAAVTSCGTNAPTSSTPPCTTAPPVAPTEPTSSSTTVSTYAIDTVFLGDVARDGGDVARDGGTTYSTTAWKAFGFDLDGNSSDARSTDVCTRAAGAPSSVQSDGRCGTDNSFGANILPILRSLFSPSCGGCNTTCNQSALSPLVSDALRRGVYTLQLTVTGLDGTATQTARGLSLQTFPSLDFDPMNVPKFSPDEDWPVLANGLENAGDIASGAKARFSDAFMTNGVFVSGFGSMSLAIPFAGGLVSIPIRHAIVMMSVSPDGMRVTNGTLAGVIATDDLIGSFQLLAGAISRSICGSAFDGIAQQLRQCSDIQKDGNNRDGLPCDGVSVGIGFEGRRIGNPKRITSAPPVLDPCAFMSVDAGTD